VQLWLHLAAFCTDDRRQEQSASFTTSIRVVNAHSDIQIVLDFSRFMERAVLAVAVVFPFSVIVGQSRAEACSYTAITATRCSEPRYTCRCGSHGGFRLPLEVGDSDGEVHGKDRNEYLEVGNSGICFL